MKTEPKEALKSLIRDVFDLYETGGADIQNIVYYDAAKDAIITAFQEGQSSPKIKQLEWVETFSHYFVESPVGTYTILRVHNFEESESWCLYFNGRIMVSAIDSNEAKAAAQADFEKRVMECLINK